MRKTEAFGTKGDGGKRKNSKTAASVNPATLEVHISEMGGDVEKMHMVENLPGEIFYGKVLMCFSIQIVVFKIQAPEDFPGV